MKRLIAALCIGALLSTACGKAQVESGSNGESGPAPAEIPDLSTVTGEITVSCYDTMVYKDFLEEVAKLFEQQYEGTKVNIEAAGSMPEVKTMEEGGKKLSIMTKEDDSQEVSDYINKIGTALMSGGGPDIMAADIIPYLTYGVNGQLDDLKNYMDKDDSFNYVGLLKNVMDSVQVNGVQYILPIDYSFNYYAYDADLFNEDEKKQLEEQKPGTVAKLTEIAKPAFGRGKFSSGTGYMFNLDGGPKGMFSTLLKENYEDILNIETKKVNFTDGKFKELLETAKAYSEQGYIPAPATMKGETPSIDSLEKNRMELQMIKHKDGRMMLQDYNKESTEKMFMSRIGNDENDKVIGTAKNEKGETPFNYSQAYAINSNSQNKSCAWAFVKFLLSQEVQSLMSLRGFPVNDNARETKALESFKAQGQGTELAPEKKELYDKYIKDLNTYSGALNSFTVEDSTINQMIDAEVSQFFSGAKSAEEVADTLQNKIELYINE